MKEKNGSSGTLMSQDTILLSQEFPRPDSRAFLVVQWLRICLLMQGTPVWSLVWEDPTCLKASKPVRCNYWVHTLEPICCNYWSPTPIVHALQQEKPPQWKAHAPQQRIAHIHCSQRKPSCSNKDPLQPKNKIHK